ncbi:MAG: malonyl-ACP O-methyltransferase BioC [Candidatus Sedimenticola sp. 20ELBAFRAG]
MPDRDHAIDKLQARRAFSRAAEHYDEVSALQREIGQRMIDRLDLVKLQPEVVLDIGAGTGVATAKLAKRYKKARVIALDFAHPMLLQARKHGSWLRKPHCLCADLDYLPLADKSVDLIYSNAAIQWSNDLEHSFKEFLRVLKPGGLLMFTTFGPDTLKELRMAWSEADGGSGSHVSSFLDMHDVGDALMHARFADPVMDVDRMTLTYDAVGGLMKDLKVLGAHNANSDRQRGMTGKGRLKAMTNAYEQFRTNGKLPASYEIVYGHAWAPEQVEQDGTMHIPLNHIGGMD